MKVMSRPVKSKTEKFKQGTLRKSREIVSQDFRQMSEIPPPPEKFNEQERWFWEITCEDLYEKQRLYRFLLPTIEAMAGWWYIMTESQRDIRDNGMIQIANSGYRVISPSVSNFEKAWNKLKDFTDRFGTNPLSKEKIPQPQVKSTELEEIISGRSE